MKNCKTMGKNILWLGVDKNVCMISDVSQWSLFIDKKVVSHNVKKYNYLYCRPKQAIKIELGSCISSDNTSNIKY